MGETNDVPQRLIDYLNSRPEIVAAYLFGSVAAGRAHKFSDVDVALLLAEGLDSTRAWDIRLEAMGEAEDAFGRRADVAMLHEIGSLLKFQVIHRGKLIFERDRKARIKFEVEARMEYFDYRPLLDVQDQELIRRIKTEGLGHGHKRRARALAKSQ
jgi:hypothetical protein